MRVLGIETSCDETGVALYDSERGIVAERLFSQIELHREFGGVVPELASRDHIRRTLPLVQAVLDEAGITGGDIDGVAYTAGPGLLGALLVGAMLGRSLAFAWGVPAIGVHHMEGHLLAPMLGVSPPTLPLVALLVSGGHTQLVRVDGIGAYELLGDTLDDAAGEAFDKTAKMLGLPYPGGPQVAALAQRGDSTRFELPRPMTTRPGLDFSFSGLKTAVLTLIEQQRGTDSGLSETDRADIAAAFEEAVVQTLVIKCRRALKATGLEQLVIAGGVSANQALRAALTAMTAEAGARVSYPSPALCTDNGAMIAYAGYRRLAAGLHDSTAVVVRARWPLESLEAVGS